MSMPGTARTHRDRNGLHETFSRVRIAACRRLAAPARTTRARIAGVLLVCAGALAVCGSAVAAPAKVPTCLAVNTMFGSNMVLQREQPVPVWGTGVPDRIVMDNVMLGEVWLCSGQSNMAFVTAEVDNAPAELAAANAYPNIRLYPVSKWGSFARTPQTQAGGKWVECSSKTISNFSAVGYFFARDLTTTTLHDVAIGLIDASRGATRIESWMSTPTLRARFAWSELRDSGFGATISSCYNGMIAPVIP